MLLRDLRELEKNEREQGIICRMIKSLIKITSQDQMASRESGVSQNPNGASTTPEGSLARLLFPY